MKLTHAFLLILGFGILSSSPLYAEKKTHLEIRNRSKDLNKINEEINRKKEEKENIKLEEQTLNKSVKESETKVKSIEQALLYTKKKNSEIETSIAHEKNDMDRLKMHISDSQLSAKRLAGTYYLASGLVGPSSLDSAIARQVYFKQTGQIQSLSELKRKKDNNFVELTQTYQVVQNEVKSQESVLNSIKSGISDKEKQIQKKITRREMLENEMKELEKSKEELSSLIDNLRSKAKQEEVEEKKARLQNQKTGPSPIAAHSLPWPIRGKIEKRFGRQTQAELGTPFISNGILIQTQDSSSVLCVSDGRVLYAGQFMSYGFMVVVEHPGDWYSVYGQLASWTVEKGQQVKRGDSIGMSGLSPKGNSETYFELRFYGKPTDPLPWFEQ